MSNRKSNLYPEYRPLPCFHCGSDLLKKPATSTMAFVKQKGAINPAVVIDFYWTCTGECEQKVELDFQNKNCIITKENLASISIPYNFLHWMLANFELIHKTYLVYEPLAFSRLKLFLSTVPQLSFRDHNENDFKQMNHWD